MWSAERTRLLLFGLVSVLCLSVSGTAPPNDFERGVRAYEQGAYQEARSQLRSVFAENPARVSHEQGAVAYWLGKTYKACNRPDSMRWAWKRGTKALKEKDRFAARLFDARLWMEWSGASERSEAVDTYLSLLSHAGPNLDDRARPVLRRHVTQLRPVLPESQEKHVFRRSGESTDEFQLKKGAGPWLVSWWGSKDPLPATAVNERVEEHLRRVRYAKNHFAHDADLANFDARGDLHVRYGAPTDMHTIPFTDLDFLQEVMHLGVRVSPSDFPDNVIWKYPSIGERGSYLFVKEGEGYRLGTAMDLFPEELKRRYNASDRSQNRAYSSLAAMRYIYEHLAMHYRDPGNVYPKVTQYFNVQRARENSVLQGTSEIGQGAGAREVYQGLGVPSPGEVANRNLRKAENRDKMFIQRREKEMPQSRSSAATTSSTFPVQIRPIRYLDESGSTRLDVLWGSPQVDTGASEGPQQITTWLVAYDQAYRRQSEKMMRHQFSIDTEEENTSIRSRAAAITVNEDLYHIAIQWDRHDIRNQGTVDQLGEQTGRQSVRLDSLQALSSDPGQLEMSDLRPMVVPDGSEIDPANPMENAEPYPFSTLAADNSLLLFFEVYHLTYNSQEQTRYEVSYEVLRETDDGGGFLGIGGSDVKRTVSTSLYTADSRTDTEVVRLDLGDASPEKTQPVQVNVRIKDEVSGQKVERQLNFRLQPSRESR